MDFAQPGLDNPFGIFAQLEAGLSAAGLPCDDIVEQPSILPSAQSSGCLTPIVDSSPSTDADRQAFAQELMQHLTVLAERPPPLLVKQPKLEPGLSTSASVTEDQSPHEETAKVKRCRRETTEAERREKLERRLQHNRLSARASRERKRKYVEELEEQIRDLQRKLSAAESQIVSLKVENHRLATSSLESTIYGSLAAGPGGLDFPSLPF